MMIASHRATTVRERQTMYFWGLGALMILLASIPAAFVGAICILIAVKM